MTDIGLGFPALVLLPLLIALAMGLSALARLGHTHALPVAAVRAVLQLAAVGLVVGVALTSYVLAIAFLVMMLTVSAVTSGRRLSRMRRAIPYAAIAIALPALTVLALLLITGSVPNNPSTLLPLGGILIGGAMSATSVAGKRILAEMAHGRGQYEAAVSLGFSSRQAVRIVVGKSAGDALLPALDQTRTVGLVTLPGTFVGMILGGAEPAMAAALQLVVLICLLVVEVGAILLITELAATVVGQD